jgi:hypothetical protein
MLAGEIGGAHRLRHEHTGMDRTTATVKAPTLRVRLRCTRQPEIGAALAGEIGGAHRLHHEHTGMDRTTATVKAPTLRVRLRCTRQPEIGAALAAGAQYWPGRSGGARWRRRWQLYSTAC